MDSYFCYWYTISSMARARLFCALGKVSYLHTTPTPTTTPKNKNKTKTKTKTKTNKQKIQNFDFYKQICRKENKLKTT